MRVSQAFRDLMRSRLLRRDVLVGSLASGLLPSVPKAQTNRPARARVAPSAADRVVVPDGYTADVLLRWGDPVVPGATAMNISGLADGSLFEPGAARAQAGCFGVNCDGMGVFELGPDRILLCINHEYVIPALMIPRWIEARQGDGRGRLLAANPEAVRVMQAAVGLTVAEFERRDGHWQLVSDSVLNRRVTAGTPTMLSGPAADHDWFRDGGAVARGTLGNCAAGTTPWRTYLTAEENVQDFFGNAANAELDAALGAAHAAFGVRRRDSAFRWEYVDRRFDIATNPVEPIKFGWIVEVDPFDSTRPIKKRTALGRFRHEGATTLLAPGGRAVVYMGDDEAFRCFYKFVSRDRFDPQRPERNDALLDEGTLYVARLDADGSGEWLPLVYGEQPLLNESNGFASQADVVIRCRDAARLVGGTSLDRPEDVAVHPETGDVYLACTQNNDRGIEPGRQPDAASPRPRNVFGHILEFSEDGNDAAATQFRWSVFVLAGDPDSGGLRLDLPSVADLDLRPTETFFAGQSNADELSAFANPDNLTFDAAGRLWIVTDGRQPLGNNNGCFVTETRGMARGAVTQFMSGPIGAEICGCEFSPNQDTLFLTIQHPGQGGSLVRPISDWPDGRGQPARSSLVAIRADDPSREFGS